MDGAKMATNFIVDKMKKCFNIYEPTYFGRKEVFS